MVDYRLSFNYRGVLRRGWVNTIDRVLICVHWRLPVAAQRMALVMFFF